MHKDESHQEVVSKFSFIESLSISKDKTSSDRPNWDSSIVATAESATTIDTKWYPPETDSRSISLAELVRAVSNEATTIPIRDNISAQNNYLGKLLFALSCSYCLFVLWWLFGHQGNRLLAIIAGEEQVVLSKSDVEFIDYMERSLAKIDRQQAEVQQEVVYVPVYTPTPAPSQPQIPAVSYNAPPTATPITPEAIKIPVPPPLPAPTPITGNSAANNTTAIASDKPAVIRTLLGILELGEDRSAALIEVGGQTRRVAPGEQMSDGLFLESVGDSKATISDRGIIRSISVGETF